MTVYASPEEDEVAPKDVAVKEAVVGKDDLGLLETQTATVDAARPS